MCGLEGRRGTADQQQPVLGIKEQTCDRAEALQILELMLITHC